MKNKYEVRGEITAIIINSPKYGILEALISTSKLELVSEFPNSWCVAFNKHSQSFYVRGRLPGKKCTNVPLCLHRHVTNAPSGFDVDHINHNTLDNTDENLRVVTVSENQQNRISSRIDSNSGIRGVSLHKPSGRWAAKIKINNKRLSLGYFDTAEEAERVVILERANRMPYSQEALAN